MFSRFRSSKKKATRRKSVKARRRLMTESLESRRLLAGVINVDTTTAGMLLLEGDSSNNVVAVHGTGVPGQMVITGEGTLLRLDGGLQTFSTLTVNGITDDIDVDLKNGKDTFKLGNETSSTKIGDDVRITNLDDDTNMIVNVDIGDDLEISRGDIASSDLTIVDSIIRDDVEIDNGDGDSKTMIEDSEIEGLLVIENGDGDDVTVVEGSSIGANQFSRPDDTDIVSIPVVSISNGDGSSLTTFTRRNDPDASGFLPTGEIGRPTIYGGIDIENGTPLPAGLQVAPPTAGGSTPDELKIAVDIVVFNEAVVLGHLDIENNDGHTETIIVNSQLGVDTKPVVLAAGVPTAESGYGEAVTVANGNGFDVVLVNASTMQYGLKLDNDAAAAGASLWGSQTDIRDSEIGGRDSTKLGSGVALTFSGDDGDDVFNISDTTAAGTTIDGDMIVDLKAGDDSVQILGVPGTVSIDTLNITGGEGNDSVSLENAEIESMVMVVLGSGVDTLEIRTGVTLPNPLISTRLFDGGLGADFYHLEDVSINLISFEQFIA